MIQGIEMERVVVTLLAFRSPRLLMIRLIGISLSGTEEGGREDDWSMPDWSSEDILVDAWERRCER
jgi:hypothetical protein